MRAVMIALALLMIAGLINFVRGGDFHIAKTLPFCGGHEPGLYDVGAVIMIIIAIWGIRRVVRNADRDSKTPDHHTEEADSRNHDEA